MGTSNKNSCKTAAVMGLLGRGPAAERDVQVLADKPRDIEVITSEILKAKRAGGEAILTIGRGLIEAKALLSHGEWLPWLEDRVEFSERAAQNFMRIARNYSNPQALADLGATKALMLLAVPEDARDEFIAAAHVVGGEEKTVIDMTSRELDAAIKARDEALMAAEQAKADQSAAEEARAKMAQDMAMANQLLEAAQAERNAAVDELRDKQEAFAASESEIARLEQELEALRSRPVEVAVEADPAAVEAARKEAEARMQAELDEMKKAKAEAEKARKAAEAATAAAQLEVAQANAKLEDVRLQAEAAQKKAAVTTDADLVLFSELLDQTQILVKRMGGVRLKKKAKAPETAEKLQSAMMALAAEVKEAAQK